MSLRRVLFIDDNPPEEIIGKLRRSLQKKGITLQESVLHLDDTFKKNIADGQAKQLDFDKIKEDFERAYFNENYDVVASDYDYKDSVLDGYVLIKWLKNTSTSKKARLRKAKFCLYSAQGDKLAQGLDSIEEVKKFNRVRIDEIFIRENLADELSTILSQEDTKFNYSMTLIEFLEKYKDDFFENTYPPFKGKRLQEIAEEITKESHHGIAFQKHLVELTLSHFITINDQIDKE